MAHSEKERLDTQDRPGCSWLPRCWVIMTRVPSCVCSSRHVQQPHSCIALELHLEHHGCSSRNGEKVSTATESSLPTVGIGIQPHQSGSSTCDGSTGSSRLVKMQQWDTINCPREHERGPFRAAEKDREVRTSKGGQVFVWI